MSQVIEILRSLGIDGTVFYQFVIFFVAYISMNYIVFKPYLKAYDERVRRTVGGQEEAELLLKQAADSEEIYKQKARQLNMQIRSIFTEKNTIAKNESEEILGRAKAEAEASVEAARKDLQIAVAVARKEMETYIPVISENIQQKFMRH